MTNLYKYPRTLHLNWSEGISSDDKVLSSVDHFIGREVVVSEKTDGENTNFYRNHYHARSLDSKNHPSRDYVKQFWGSIKHEIPDGYRISGENVYARHSIHYHFLPAYFLVFAIYDGNNVCLSWDETVEWASMLGLQTVPVLYRGSWDEERVKACWTGKSVFKGPKKRCQYCDKDVEVDDQEGYVVRFAGSFPWSEHGNCTGKMVRKGHVQTSAFWMHEKVVPNLLA